MCSVGERCSPLSNVSEENCSSCSDEDGELRAPVANESGESVSCFLSEAFAEGENCSVIADEGGEMSSKSES